MKKIIYPFTLGICAILLGTLIGCNSNSPARTPAQISSDISSLATPTVSIALTEFGKKNPDTVKKVATDLAASIDTSILPYLNGGTNLTANAVSTAEQVDALSKLPPEVQDGINLAAALLDQYLPEPTSDTVLTADQLSYLKAFFTSTSAACHQYLDGTQTTTVSKDMKKAGRWFKKK